jgi:NAD(P)-dependent dehydrogenase (short-subunit alcohol dehydrogenase family)
MSSPVDFTGRAVIVTGGTRGIGRVITETFLAAGADVLVCGRKEPGELPAAAGRTAAFTRADVRDPEQAKSVVTAAADRFGRLDVLVNNAGGSPSAAAATVSPRFVERIVALNLLAPFYVAQAANAVMQQQEAGGEIINIGSVSARQAAPFTAAYSAAKAGLIQLTRSLALEWAPKVRVNHITAGLILTENAAGHYGDDGGRSVARTIPMGRMGVPADIASACLFLASPLATYVTGADLEVHGGGEIPARFLAAQRQRSADPSEPRTTRSRATGPR